MPLAHLLLHPPTPPLPPIHPWRHLPPPFSSPASYPLPPTERGPALQTPRSPARLRCRRLRQNAGGWRPAGPAQTNTSARACSPLRRLPSSCRPRRLAARPGRGRPQADTAAGRSQPPSPSPPPRGERGGWGGTLQAAHPPAPQRCQGHRAAATLLAGGRGPATTPQRRRGSARGSRVAGGRGGACPRRGRNGPPPPAAKVSPAHTLDSGNDVARH